MEAEQRFKSALHKIRELKIGGGFHTKREERAFWTLAKQAVEGVVVEIGSFEGYSTILLAEATGGHRDIFAIDPHTGRLSESDEGASPFTGDSWLRFKDNIRLAGVEEKIKPLKMKSEDAAKNWHHGRTIGLLYIDGSHRYEDVKKDIVSWKPYLCPGAKVLFHDLWKSGVRRAIIEHILSDKAFGQFHYAPYSLFVTTYSGDRYHPQFIQRNFWKVVLGLMGALDRAPGLKRFILNRLLVISKRL